ncbi:methyltransferase N6AMT1 [Diabrotica undecimpunctata]|uniref:methyltransferase N6AMT1 n=1 Tax=Diabrotica undecimpunctata TaxID=50387 RepID=UPI003B63EF64
MNLSTPIYSLGQFPEVYEPREDTFLFLDALESDSLFLKSLQPTVIAEVGTGSGVIISAMFQIFGTSCAYFGTDVNNQCCLAAQLTSKLNKTTVETMTMDLLTNFKNKICDIVLFNPPYVVTEQGEICGNGLNRSWAGGSDGREITDKLLNNLPNILSEKGVCYVVLLKENRLKDIVKNMEELGFNSQIVLERKIPGEHLFVYKFFKKLDV